MAWTTNQQEVIDSRGKNLLVSAAAGSGKTAVLVERIISRVTEDLANNSPVDIDRILVVTFTKAAAAEMRGRIADRIQKLIDEDPSNERLRRQYTLVNHAQITTIDSFCNYIVRNYFYTVGLEPGFRIADKGEIKLLQRDVLEELLEEKYDKQSEDEEFKAFARNYITSKGDDELAEMILKLLDKAGSRPWMEEWLLSLVKIYEKNEVTDLLEEGSWFDEYRNRIHEEVYDLLIEARKLFLECSEDYLAPKGYSGVFEKIVELLETVNLAEDFEGKLKALSSLKLPNLKADKGEEVDEEVKKIYTEKKSKLSKQIKAVIEEYPANQEQIASEELKILLPNVKALVNITIELMHRLDERKRALNIQEFSDIEHAALEILVDKNTKMPTLIAEDLKRNFEEIMIDEYQDSNDVQEAILGAISKDDNRFMVGDVKQSIYRFRQAKPEIFMDKYEKFSLAKETLSKTICLDRNFRSRAEVLDSVNDVFERVMKKDVGGVRYDEEARLVYGESYANDYGKNHKTAILVMDSCDETAGKLDLSGKEQLEGAMLAKKIRELVDGKYPVAMKDKDGESRPLKYGDIAILCRSTRWAGQLVKSLSKFDVPSYVASSNGYFDALEVNVVLSCLKAIDNPLDDISFMAMLKLPGVDFTDDELVFIRRTKYEGEMKPFLYDSLVGYLESGKEDELTQKIKSFLERFGELRNHARKTAVHEFLNYFFKVTGYMDFVYALPGGERRRANLYALLNKALSFEATSYKGLFSFVRYIEQLKTYSEDEGEVEVNGESGDVVRIITIHSSKGLEYSVVFVAGCGRGINKMDLNGSFIFDDKFGIGLEIIERDKHQKYTPVFKNMVKNHIKKELWGEELRVLYVAMTRAKEKLFLTGTIKDLDKTEEEYKADSKLSISEITGSRILKAASCLDWIYPAALAKPESFEIERLKGEKLVTDKDEEGKKDLIDAGNIILNVNNVDTEGESYLKVKELLEYRYPFENRRNIKHKLSVSDVKRKHMEEAFENNIFENNDVSPKDKSFMEKDEDLDFIPKFLSGKGGEIKENEGAIRGTAIHRFMECVDYSKIDLEAGVTENDIEEMKESFLNKGLITLEQAKLISPERITPFFEGELARRIKSAFDAGKLYREKAFVMGMDASAFYEDLKENEETVLIQGIIDLYFIENNNIIIVDYKTDSVKKAEELVERYKTQLDLYAEAMEKALGLKVSEKLIYSFKLNEVISVKNR